MHLSIRILLILNFVPIFICAQNNYSPIVGRWEFQSLSINYLSTPPEQEEIKKSEKYYENIVFLPYGQFSFQGKSSGEDLVGNGTYKTNGKKLTTTVNNISTFTEFSITDDILIINKFEEETEDFYAMKTKFIYIKTF